jgi:tetratricopeptide (TPR) repeat protein
VAKKGDVNQQYPIVAWRDKGGWEENMDYETVLSDAIDALADEEAKKAERILNELIENAKKGMDGSESDANRYFAWGRALRLLEEPEQALLRLEQVFGLKPNHEGALWETASILLHDLEKAELASEILEKRLLPLRPGDDLYQEALDIARFRLRLSKSPPEPGEDGDDLI